MKDRLVPYVVRGIAQGQNGKTSTITVHWNCKSDGKPTTQNLAKFVKAVGQANEFEFLRATLIHNPDHTVYAEYQKL